MAVSKVLAQVATGLNLFFFMGVKIWPERQLA